jgi:two-component system sensor histidine kinase KdpD
MLSYMREHAITGPWGAGERVLVCIDPGPDAANTVRAAKRTAQGLDAELIALYVETDRTRCCRTPSRRGSPRRCGWPSSSVPRWCVRPDAPSSRRSWPLPAPATSPRVVVGKSLRSRWFELRHGSVVDQLVRSGSGLAVEVAPSGDRTQPADPVDWLFDAPRTVGPYLEGVLTTAVATVAGVVIDAYINLPTSRWSMSCR